MLFINAGMGDYFKEEAINFKWEWVTKILQLPAEKLYATVYEEDDEAFHLWEKIAPQLKNGRILRFGKESNYWSMGETGPTGPNSEIFYDRGEKYSCGQPTCGINCDCDRYDEIGNLVFMQYNQKPDGTMEPLPHPSVDTGAGLERITAIMQNAYSNYETDVFADIIAHIEELSMKKYDTGESGVSHRVIADHLRALTFCV
ncbi:MAG: alanine--tRNA ligase-related protein, partial [candidate division Zixibacteria bacterium]|nr:alanine--tRNA ligase-related protein [candidate division Zixibacteria bacterium]